MSWDRYTNKIKCPCGKGTIEQEIKDHDSSNRTEYGKPYINCPFCESKYKIVSIVCHDYKPWHGDTIAYYLVPKDFQESVEYINKYRVTNYCGREMSDFAFELIMKYSLKSLKDVMYELEKNSNAGNLNGTAKSMVNMRKKLYGKASIKDLSNDVQKAIDKYESFNGNYQQLREQEEQNRMLREEHNDKIQKKGILIDI